MKVGKGRGLGPHKGSLLCPRRIVKGLLLLGIMAVVFFCLYIPLVLVFPKPLGSVAKFTEHQGTFLAEGVHSREKRAALFSTSTKPKPAYEGREICGPTYPDKIFPTGLDSYFQDSSSGNIGIKAVDNPALEGDYILPNNKTVAQNRKHHVEICRQYLGQTWSDISKKPSKYELWQHGFSQSGQDKWLWDEAMLTSTKVRALLAQKYKYRRKLFCCRSSSASRTASL